MQTNTVLQFVALVALLAIIAPLLKLSFYRSFLRRLCLFPRLLFLLAGATAAYLAGATAVIVYFPDYLNAMIVLSLVTAFYLHYWRARPGYGKRNRLPPGSLRLAPVGPWTNYLFYKAQEQQHGPIYKMSNIVRPMVCITSIKDAKRFLGEFDLLLDTPPLPFNHFIPGGFIRYMEPDLHRPYRSVLTRVLTNTSFLEENNRAATEEFERLLEKMSETSPVNPSSCVQSTVFNVMVILFLGIHRRDPMFDRIRRLYKSIDYRRAHYSPRWRVERCLTELEDMVDACARRDRTSYAKDFLGRSASTDSSVRDKKTIYRNLIYLLQTSWFDVSDLIVWIVKMLADHPDTLEVIRRTLQVGTTESRARAGRLADCIVWETLRLEQSEYLMRKTKKDIHYEGYFIPKGWLVKVGVREGHRDQHVFDHPHEFRPDRFIQHSIDWECFSPLGMPPRTCLGKSLLMWICRNFLLELANGFTIRSLDDGPRELGVFHWSPSDAFRVRVSRVSTKELQGPGQPKHQQPESGCVG